MEVHGHGVKWTQARDRRCRPIWRRPENQRRDRKPLAELNGEPWNTPLRQEEKLQIQDRECIALKQQIKCGGQKVCMACTRHTGANPRDLIARAQDIVDHEVAQADRASSNVSPGKTPNSLSKGTTQKSTSSDTALSAGRPALEDSHIMRAAVAGSSTTQSTTSLTIRVVERTSPTPNARRCWQADQIGTEPLRTWTRAMRST